MLDEFTGPRSVRLLPERMVVPAGALAVFLGKANAVRLEYSGHGFWPWLSHGDQFEVRNGTAGPGDLVLANSGGWADVRRVLRRDGEGNCTTAIDAHPRFREQVPRERVMGVVAGVGGSGGTAGRSIARGFSAWSRIASARYWVRRLQELPTESLTEESVLTKYTEQVTSYAATQQTFVRPDVLQMCERFAAPGARVLVAACGAGSEALGFARAGYAVTAFDFVPGMIDVARQAAAAEGLEVEFVRQGLSDLQLRSEPFDFAYITSLVYSMIPGRSARVDALRRIGRHLAPGGALVFGANMKLPTRIPRALAAWLWTRRQRRDAEFGDWYTWYASPSGDLGKSFTHHFFSAGAVTREAREAGFAHSTLEADGLFLNTQKLRGQ